MRNSSTQNRKSLQGDRDIPDFAPVYYDPDCIKTPRLVQLGEARLIQPLLATLFWKSYDCSDCESQ
jgi:hypothetical protein